MALLDLKMPGINGEDLMLKLKERDPLIEVVILTGHGSIRSATDCTRYGAFDYLLKPCEIDDVIAALSSAYAKRIKAKNEAKAERVNEILANAIGYGPVELLKELKKIADD